MAPYRKNFGILFWTNLWLHRFTFCVQILRKSTSGKWVKRCVVVCCFDLNFDKKIPKCGFSPPFCASLQGSMPRDPTSHCKILFESVPVSWSYSQENNFVRPQYMPSAYNDVGHSKTTMFCENSYFPLGKSMHMFVGNVAKELSIPLVVNPLLVILPAEWASLGRLFTFVYTEPGGGHRISVFLSNRGVSII